MMNPDAGAGSCQVPASDDAASAGFCWCLSAQQSHSRPELRVRANPMYRSGEPLKRQGPNHTLRGSNDWRRGVSGCSRIFRGALEACTGEEARAHLWQVGGGKRRTGVAPCPFGGRGRELRPRSSTGRFECLESQFEACRIRPISAFRRQYQCSSMHFLNAMAKHRAIALEQHVCVHVDAELR